MYRINFIILSVLISLAASGQTARGVVLGQGEDRPIPLPGANLHWSGTTYGTTTDENGNFELEVRQDVLRILVISYVGYQNDTVHVHDPRRKVEVILEPTIELKTVEISERQASTILDTRKAINIEVLSEKELAKAASE